MKRVPVRDPDSDRIVHALVDDDDHALVSGRCWTLRLGYAVGNAKHPTCSAWRPGRGWPPRSVSIAMHRLILGIKTGDARMVRHRNRNRLDNRRANLRIVVPKRNPTSQPSAPERYTPYLGVEWDASAQKWRAVAQRADGASVLGLFDDDAEAAIVTNRWRVEHAASDDTDAVGDAYGVRRP